MVMILLLLCFILIIYWGVPFILTRVFGIGVMKRKDASKYIAFTFDDGPNPIYTPQLLDLLKKNHIKATFFVVGSKAEKYPELIARMHKEGHLIGIHNYVHQANWAGSPWTIRRELRESAEIIEKITGEYPIYYRPPWGLLTLFDFFLMKKFKIILWSVMAEDWRSKGGSEKIKTRLGDIKGGDIVLLHDCGETFGADQDAPMNTIAALEEIFIEMSSREMACVRIDEL